MNKFIIIIIIIIIIIVFISKSRKTTKASANTKPPENKSGKGSAGQDDQPGSAQPTGISIPTGISPQYPYKSASVTKPVIKYYPLSQAYVQECPPYRGPVMSYEEGEPTLPPYFSSCENKWFLNGVEIPPPEFENKLPDAPLPYNAWQDPMIPGYVFGGTSDKTRPGYDPDQDRTNPNGALFDPYFSNPID